MSAQYKNYSHYLNDGWHKEPKEMFKFLANEMGDLEKYTNGQLLDIGCASGELLAYLSTVFPHLNFTGVDVFNDLISSCEQTLPDMKFINASALELPQAFDNQFDIVTVVSMISILDTDQLPIFWDNILRVIKPGGVVYILSPFNEYGVDCEIRHRKRLNQTPGEWESGWNIFSKETVSESIGERCKHWSFTPFNFGLDLERREDPVRTWTIKTEQNDRQLMNGLKLLVDLYLFKVHF